MGTAYETATRYLRPLFDESSPNLSAAESESIRRVLDSSVDELDREKHHFESVFSPVGMLPPDQYRAIVLQAVTGCPYDCSFCTLYRDSEMKVRSIPEFEDHVAAVKSFFGRGLRSRRTVFLGDANPLAASEEMLTGILDVVARELPEQYEKGVHTFLNVRTAANTPVQKFETLANRGLEGVYFGVESGSSEVLDQLQKPQTPDEIVTGIERVKSAGIRTGVIVMAGVGGHELAGTHLSTTIDLIDRLPLDSHDIVYVSPLTVSGSDGSEQWLQQSNPMDEIEIAAQTKRLTSALPEHTPARVSTYHVSDFTYF
ncbi:radical SAM protein [Haladaptatus sp. NG-SE-30]